MSTSKKKLITASIILVFFLFIFAFLGYIYTETSSQGAKIIGVSPENAQNIALKEAGLDTKDIKLIECDLDMDGLRSKYEIEFYSNGKKYEYDISARNGKILGKEIKPYSMTI